MRLEVIIPYRNRKENLAKQLPHLSEILEKQGLDYGITVVEQEEGKLFNTGQMKNIGFLESPHADYFCFHDVDMYAEDADYSPVSMPTHLAAYVQQFDYKMPFRTWFGGVTLFDRDSYLKINGYSNEYWGWAVDDDDLYWRCTLFGFNRRFGRFWSDNHPRDNYTKWQQENWHKFQMNKEHIELSGLSNCSYGVIDEKEIQPKIRHILVSI